MKPFAIEIVPSVPSVQYTSVQCTVYRVGRQQHHDLTGARVLVVTEVGTNLLNKTFTIENIYGGRPAL